PNPLAVQHKKISHPHPHDAHRPSGDSLSTQAARSGDGTRPWGSSPCTVPPGSLAWGEGGPWHRASVCAVCSRSMREHTPTRKEVTNIQVEVLSEEIRRENHIPPD